MASYTENLGLIKYSTNEAVKASVAGYGDNFDKIDEAVGELSADYVIDCKPFNNGTVTWYYRKWASGIAECWIEEYTTNVSMTSGYANGNMYTGNIASPGAYPFTFKSLPLVLPTFSSKESSVGYSFPIWAKPTGTLTNCPDFQGLDQSRGTATVTLAIYVKGRWK